VVICLNLDEGARRLCHFALELCGDCALQGSSHVLLFTRRIFQLCSLKKESGVDSFCFILKGNGVVDNHNLGHDTVKIGPLPTKSFCC